MKIEGAEETMTTTTTVIRKLKRSGIGELTIKKEDQNLIIKCSEPILCTLMEEEEDDHYSLTIESLSNIGGGNISVYGFSQGSSIMMCNGQTFINGVLHDPSSNGNNAEKKERDSRFKRDWSFPHQEITLQKISLSGTGKVSLPDNIISHQKFKVSQSGTVNLNLDCSTSLTNEKERKFGEINISKSGTGSTKCPLYKVDHLKVSTSGTSKLMGFFVEDSCSLSASGTSKISITKSTRCQVLKKSTSGCAKILIE